MGIEIRGMAPLLSVFDMPTSLNFYCRALGFDLVAHDAKTAPDSDWVWLRRGETELMLNTAYDRNRRPPIPDGSRIAAHQDVCLYFGCPDVDRAYADLKALGVKSKEPKVAPYGMKQLYLSDPDGYQVCFQWPVKDDGHDQ